MTKLLSHRRITTITITTITITTNHQLSGSITTITITTITITTITITTVTITTYVILSNLHFSFSWLLQVQFMKKAVDSLCHCRQTLQYTYAFAFYLKKNNQTYIFEVKTTPLLWLCDWLIDPCWFPLELSDFYWFLSLSFHIMVYSRTIRVTLKWLQSVSPSI